MTGRVSIIVPVFNAGEPLARCLGSLAAVDYPDKEIILVDDGSTDGSGGVCDSFGKSHQEAVIIHHGENKGVAEARITGFDSSTGEYILFVDADDYVSPDILSVMVDAARSSDADMTCCRVFETTGDNSRLMEQSFLGLYDQRQILDMVAARLFYDSSVNAPGMPANLWGKLYRRSTVAESLLEGRGFSWGEDLLVFVGILVRHTRRLLCLEDPLYHYVKHPGQMTATDKAMLIDRELAFLERFVSLYGEFFEKRQLAVRIWENMRPSIYRRGDIIRMSRLIRNNRMAKEFIWDNPELPSDIRRHPHWLLLKLRLYHIDCLMYSLIRLTVRIAERIKR